MICPRCCCLAGMKPDASMYRSNLSIVCKVEMTLALIGALTGLVALKPRLSLTISNRWKPGRALISVMLVIDLCIKNAIIGVQEQNTYAQTERERRPTRRSAQASPGAAGFWLLSQRSGTAHWLQSKFGDALAQCPTEGRSPGITGALLPRATVEVGSAATTALGQPSSAGADDARLPN